MSGSRRSFDRVAALYDRTRAMPPAAAAGVTAGIAAALRAVSTRPRVLEVGVGTGRLAVPLAAAGVRVVGIDVARAMLARLDAKGGAVVRVLADAIAPPFRAATLDGALFVHVLHLVADPLAVVRAARRVVRPGGVLLLGRTEYGPSLRGEVIDLTWRTVAALGGPVRPEVDWNAATTAAFTTAASESGATVREATLARWTDVTTGRRLLGDLAERVYSSSWAIPDAVMPALLARLEPAVATATGDLDRPLATEVSFVLASARLPGATA